MYWSYTRLITLVVEFESHIRDLDGFVVFFLEENESELTFEKTFRGEIILDDPDLGARPDYYFKKQK